MKESENIGIGGMKQNPNYKEILDCDRMLSGYQELYFLLMDLEKFTYTGYECFPVVKDEPTRFNIHTRLVVIQEMIANIQEEIISYKDSLLKCRQRIYGEWT